MITLLLKIGKNLYVNLRSHSDFFCFNKRETFEEFGDRIPNFKDINSQFQDIENVLSSQ